MVEHAHRGQARRDQVLARRFMVHTYGVAVGVMVGVVQEDLQAKEKSEATKNRSMSDLAGM